MNHPKETISHKKETADQCDSKKVDANNVNQGVVETKPTDVSHTNNHAQKIKAKEHNAGALLPRVDVYEDATGITLLADLPGVQKDQLSIRVEGDMLHIEGEMLPNMPEALEPTYAEVQTPRYRRILSLSHELDTTKIDAILKDGVLTLRIPKQEHAQPRKIEIRAS